MLKTLSSEKNNLLLYITFGLGVLLFVILLFFRFPAHDETLYLQETLLMSELLKSGDWFGAYGVGLHGFLFKVPLALVFTLTGPSVLVATLYNYFLASLTLYLTYLLAKKIFKSKIESFLIVLLTMFAFEFVRSAPTYLREMPSLISILLFLYFYIKKEKELKLGLALLLILDAKEYMFFVIGIAYSISEFIILIKDGVSIQNIWNLIKSQVMVYSFSIIYLILMFTTTIVPVNMFVASILGLIDKGLNWNTQQFSSDSGSNNVVNSGDVKEIFKIAWSSGISLIDMIIKWLNLGLGYIGKFLYPRSFSFISIPKLILVPSLVYSFIYLKKWVSFKDRRVLIPITIFVFLIIFLLRSSHGRYLFPISPLIFISFLLFLKDIPKNWRFGLGVLSITWGIEVLGMYFETSMILMKSILTLVIFVSFIVYLYFSMKNYSKSSIYLTAVLLLICIISLFSSIAFSVTQGQIKYSLIFGSEYEYSRIVPYLDKYKKIYTNENKTTKLSNFYLYDLNINPLWKWQLKEFLPKSKQLKRMGDTRINIVENIPYDELNEFGSALVIYESTISSIHYQNQKTIPSLISDSRLRQVVKLELKGKNIYIFQSNENNN